MEPPGFDFGGMWALGAHVWDELLGTVDKFLNLICKDPAANCDNALRAAPLRMWHWVLGGLAAYVAIAATMKVPSQMARRPRVGKAVVIPLGGFNPPATEGVPTAC